MKKLFLILGISFSALVEAGAGVPEAAPKAETNPKVGVSVDGKIGRSIVEVNVTVNSKVGVTSCGRGNCSTTVNAVGEDFNVDLSKIKSMNLGKILQSTKITLPLPADKQITVFTLEPSQGTFNGQTVYVAIQSLQARAGTRLAGNQVYKIFKRLDADKWGEIGSVTSKDAQFRELSVVINPSGNIRTVNPKTLEEVELFIDSKS